MTALLEAKGICTAYGRVQVLRDVGLQVRAAGITAVIGPNGAGKSTLLNALIGLKPVSAGEISFAGKPLARLGTEDRVDLGMGLVPERRELFGSMTVEDNLRLGTYRSGNHDLGDMYALFPRLEERKRQLASTLSGGERQMLALARALLARPRLLMLDEPSLGLAPLVVRETLARIRELRQLGMAVLLVEQNARAALDISDYAYVLETGQIVLEGPAAVLAADPRVAKSYLGLGDMEPA